jgi:glycosyltransferase involved in cell wall biosynthesis
MRYDVLYLSYDGLTDPLGQSQILPYLCGLSKRGYRIQILSFEKKDRIQSGYNNINSICSQYSIAWIPLTYHKKPPIVSTLWDLFVAYKKAARLVGSGKIALVHCRSYLMSLVGVLLKEKYGVKFLFDMRGFWADERVEGGLWNLRNPLYRLTYRYFKKKENLFLREADHIISLTDNGKTVISSAGCQKPITVIPCCVDTVYFDPSTICEEDRIGLRRKLDISEDDFVLLYLGSIGTWYMLNEMFAFFNLLNRNGGAKFLIVTTDSENEIRKTASTKNIDLNRIIVKKAERHEVPLYISIAHGSVLFIKPTFSKRASSPTKLGEVLSMGIPVVANASVGDNDFLFASDAIGVLVDDFNFETEGTLHWISALMNKSHDEIRDFAKKKLSLKMGVDSYECVYKELI